MTRAHAIRQASGCAAGSTTSAAEASRCKGAAPPTAPGGGGVLPPTDAAACADDAVFGDGLCQVATAVGCATSLADRSIVAAHCPVSCGLCSQRGPAASKENLCGPASSLEAEVAAHGCTAQDLGRLTAASCPAAAAGAYVPSICPAVCAAIFTGQPWAAGLSSAPQPAHCVWRCALKPI